MKILLYISDFRAVITQLWLPKLYSDKTKKQILLQENIPLQISHGQKGELTKKSNHCIEQLLYLGQISTAVLMCLIPNDFSEEVGGGWHYAPSLL